jgi:hypothetical protein
MAASGRHPFGTGLFGIQRDLLTDLLLRAGKILAKMGADIGVDNNTKSSQNYEIEQIFQNASHDVLPVRLPARSCFTQVITGILRKITSFNRELVKNGTTWPKQACDGRQT